MGNYSEFRIKIWGACLGILASILWIVFHDWQDFKGSFLIDKSSLHQVEGMITNSSTYTSKRKSKTVYHYKIEYTYTVASKIYYSDNVTFTGNSSTNPEYAESYIAQYPKGSPVIVFYDSANPALSVLNPDVTDAERSTIVIVLCLSALVIIGVYFAYRKIKDFT